MGKRGLILVLALLLPMASAWAQANSTAPVGGQLPPLRGQAAQTAPAPAPAAPPPAPGPLQGASPTLNAVAGPPTRIPNVEELATMLRKVILAVNDANFTGNYSVLHDLSAPSAQSLNTPEALSRAFQAMRERRVDFSIVAIASPQFKQMPSFTNNGLLRLNGEFVTSPRVTFDIFFQYVDDRWRPYAIGIGLVPVQAAAAPPAPAPKAPPKPRKPSAARKTGAAPVAEAAADQAVASD